MRDPAGTRATLGGDYPEASIYTTREFAAKYPKTVQAVTNAILRSRALDGAGDARAGRGSRAARNTRLADKDVFAQAYGKHAQLHFA